MTSIKEEILINAPIDVTYDAYFNISKWKEILSDVIDVNIIKESENYQEFDMKVCKHGSLETVKTIRICTYNKKIELKQPSPPPQVEKMEGIWIFETEKNGYTKVKAERNFLVKKNIDIDKYTNSLKKSLKKNLLHFKNYIEKIGIIEVEKKYDIPLNVSIDFFWNIEYWKMIWKNISSVKYLINNENLQEFDMSVNYEGINQVLRVVQIKKDNSINFYNVNCPQKMKIHCGSWEFENEGNGVLVTAKRIFVLKDEYTSEFEVYKINLQNRIIQMMNIFERYFKETKEYENN